MSYSTLLEICKSRISGRKNREKRDERIRFVSSFIVNCRVPTLPENVNYTQKFALTNLLQHEGGQGRSVS